MTAEAKEKKPRGAATASRQAGSAEGKKTGQGGLRLQYYHSAIATPQKHKRVIKGLGFTRLLQVVEREDTPSIRGMVARVPHLVRILES